MRKDGPMGFIFLVDTFYATSSGMGLTIMFQEGSLFNYLAYRMYGLKGL